MNNKSKITKKSNKEKLSEWVNKTIQYWSSDITHIKALHNPESVKAIKKDIAYMNQIKTLIEGEVNTRFVGKYLNKFKACMQLGHSFEGDKKPRAWVGLNKEKTTKVIRKLLEDYHKELMKKNKDLK